MPAVTTNHQDETAAVGAGKSPGAGRSSIQRPDVDPERWLHEHGDALVRFAMVRLRNREHAEEAVQECLLAALRGLNSFGGRSTERTWLVGILKRKVVDQMRRRSRERPESDATTARHSDQFDERGLWQLAPKRWSQDPSDAMHQADFGRVVNDCLSKLPPSLADAIVLRELHQLPADEVCETLAVSPQSLWQRLHRARLALRRCLELNWFDAPSQRQEAST